MIIVLIIFVNIKNTLLQSLDIRSLRITQEKSSDLNRIKDISVHFVSIHNL
jgi:hypothetical protein